MRRAVGTAMLLVQITAGEAPGQSLVLLGFPDTAFAVRCDAGTELPRDSVTTWLMLAGPGREGVTDSARRARVRRLAAAARPVFTAPPVELLPQPMVLPPRATVQPGQALAMPYGRASVRIWARVLGGGVDSVPVQGRGGWPGLADSLAVAVRRAAAASEAGLDDWFGALEVVAVMTPPSDSLVVLGARRVEVVPLDSSVAVVRRASPTYPKGMIEAGLEASLVLEFVVDADGRVVPGTIRPVRGAHPEFEAAARQAVLASAYRPARAGGCRVPEGVRQPFTFRLEP